MERIDVLSIDYSWRSLNLEVGIDTIEKSVL